MSDTLWPGVTNDPALNNALNDVDAELAVALRSTVVRLHELQAKHGPQEDAFDSKLRNLHNLLANITAQTQMRDKQNRRILADREDRAPFHLRARTETGVS